MCYAKLKRTVALQLNIPQVFATGPNPFVSMGTYVVCYMYQILVGSTNQHPAGVSTTPLLLYQVQYLYPKRPKGLRFVIVNAERRRQINSSC